MITFYNTTKNPKMTGAPDWLSGKSVWLLISGSWVQAPCEFEPHVGHKDPFKKMVSIILLRWEPFEYVNMYYTVTILVSVNGPSLKSHLYWSRDCFAVKQDCMSFSGFHIVFWKSKARRGYVILVIKWSKKNAYCIGLLGSIGMMPVKKYGEVSTLELFSWGKPQTLIIVLGT